MNRLKNELTKLTRPSPSDIIYGIAGIKRNGSKIVDVPGRDGFIFVRLRDNQSEFIQAYNRTVQNVYYDFPVQLKREGNRYVVLGKDAQRYPEWAVQQFSSNTPDVVQPQIVDVLRHGGTHSFDATNNQGGGDIAWIYSRQFMPLLVSPYSSTSRNVYIVAQTVKNNSNEWKYLGNTGTVDLVDYKPTVGGRAVFGLITIDTESGNPFLIIESGTYAPANLTGTAASILPYVPQVPNANCIPLAFVRLETGTSYIGWDNLYDARQFQGGVASLQINNTGTVSNINFPNASVMFSGTNAFVEFLGGGGGSGDSVLFSVEGALSTGTNMANLYQFTQDTELSSIYLYAKNAGVTGTTVIDVNYIRSGTAYGTIFTGQFNRPMLQYDDGDGWVYGVPDIKNFYAGDILYLDIDSVGLGSENIVVSKYITGSSSGGGNLTVGESDGSPSVVGVKKILFSNAKVTDNGGGQVTIAQMNDYILIRDEKVQNTPGGTFTAGAWQTRDLNTEVSDDGNHASVAANQVTLAAGTYVIEIHVPAFMVGRNQAKLYNVTDAADELLGASAYAGIPIVNNPQTLSKISGKITIADTKVFEVKHICETTYASQGFGVEANFATEIYTVFEAWKVA